MKSKVVHSMLGIAIGTACAASVGAQAPLDRTTLPIQEPARTKFTELDVRKATAPAREEGLA